MNCSLLIKNEEIEQSIERYLIYVLNWNVINFNRDNQTKKTSLIILIDEDIEVDEELLETFANYNKTKIVVLGKKKSNINNYINILRLSDFKINLKRAVNNLNGDSTSLIFIRDIKTKLNLFFKGHGECSLFDGLNWTRYYLSNGPALFKTNKINWQEYTDVYLKPGFKYWDIFKQRLERYQVYLKVTGFDKEIEQVKERAANFQIFIDHFLNSNKEEIKAIDDLEIKKNIDYLKQIDYIFTNIHKKIKHICHDI